MNSIRYGGNTLVAHHALPALSSCGACSPIQFRGSAPTLPSIAMLVVPPSFFTGTYSDGFFENRENFLFGNSPIKCIVFFECLHNVIPECLYRGAML